MGLQRVELGMKNVVNHIDISSLAEVGGEPHADGKKVAARLDFARFDDADWDAFWKNFRKTTRHNRIAWAERDVFWNVVQNGAGRVAAFPNERAEMPRFFERGGDF